MKDEERIPLAPTASKLLSDDPAERAAGRAQIRETVKSAQILFLLAVGSIFLLGLTIGILDHFGLWFKN